MKHCIFALVLGFALAPAAAQEAPPASSGRAALETQLLALIPLPPLPDAKARAAEVDTIVNTGVTDLLKRNPGKEAVIRPIMTDHGACMVNVLPAAVAQVRRKSLSYLSDEDLRHAIDFYTSPDGRKFLALLAKNDKLDPADKAELATLGKKQPAQGTIIAASSMSLVSDLPKEIEALGRVCIITTEKALVQAGINTGETPRYQREATFVTVAGPGITKRFIAEARGEVLLKTALKSSDLADANPDRKDAIDAIFAQETRCREQAYAALAARLLPQLAAELPYTMLDRMIAFYSGPDGARYAELDRLFNPTKAQSAVLAALRKKYALNEFDQYYGEIFLAATPVDPDPAWVAANQACDAATDQALTAAKIAHPPKSAEDKP